MNTNIALVGDYDNEVIAHQAIPKALKIASGSLNVELHYEWINSDAIENELDKQFKIFKGIWVVPASPYKNTEGVIEVIRYARENKIPFLGTCGGFQHAIIEFFRNVAGFKTADNIESNSNAQMPVISQLSCSLVEKEGEIFLKDNSKVKEICKTSKLAEKYHCNYGFNEKYINYIENSKLKISGVDENNDIRIIELEEHPFFMATLFQPERTALINKHHPIINSFVNSANLLS